jgi:hypothetical protein
MPDFFVPPRYRVRLTDGFHPGQPSQVEADLLPTGVFGVQDGRTLRRNEGGQGVVFDQKTGEMAVKDASGEPITLEPVCLDELSLGIDRSISMVGNRMTWTEQSADVGQATEAIERAIHMLLAVLPVLGYRRRAPLSVSKIFVKQQDEIVGWADLLAVNLIVRPYKREVIEQQLRGFQPWLQTVRLDTARWWATKYYDRALRCQDTPFLDDSYSEVVTNLWKAAESVLGTWKHKEIETAAKKLGLANAVAKELKWLCELRHSDDVAHAVIYRKQSAAQLRALYADRHEKVRRADNVIRALLDHVLGGQPDL